MYEVFRAVSSVGFCHDWVLNFRMRLHGHFFLVWTWLLSVVFQKSTVCATDSVFTIVTKKGRDQSCWKLAMEIWNSLSLRLFLWLSENLRLVLWLFGVKGFRIFTRCTLSCARRSGAHTLTEVSMYPTVSKTVSRCTLPAFEPLGCFSSAEHKKIKEKTTTSTCVRMYTFNVWKLQKKLKTPK